MRLENEIDFMNRMIILTKSRQRLRDENDKIIKGKYYYIELSMMRNKFFFTLIDLSQEGQYQQNDGSSLSPNRQTRIRNSTVEKRWNQDPNPKSNIGSTIDLSTTTLVVEVWKKQIHNLFSQYIDHIVQSKQIDLRLLKQKERIIIYCNCFQKIVAHLRLVKGKVIFNL